MEQLASGTRINFPLRFGIWCYDLRPYGCYYTGGRIERDISGGSGWGGYRYRSGEYIDPGDHAYFSPFSRYQYGAISLYASSAGYETTFAYDGNGNRVKKTEDGETILYINRYYEVNLTTSNATSYYYLGDRLVAMSENSTLRYIHQDHLAGTALVTDTNGDSIGTMKYYPFGETRSGSVPTDKLFTGQRLDDTGLYYYGARYYDPR